MDARPPAEARFYPWQSTALGDFSTPVNMRASPTRGRPTRGKPTRGMPKRGRTLSEETMRLEQFWETFDANILMLDMVRRKLTTENLVLEASKAFIE